MGKCSYIRSDTAMISLDKVLRDLARPAASNSNTVSLEELKGIHKEHYDFMRKLCSDNISLEKFGKMIFVDARFTDALSLTPYELQRISEIIKTGSDSFSITNCGNGDRSFSILYSFTVPEGVAAYD
ncbi:hypothetical protein [Ruminococcus sp.]|uniref:hypothetical protein n=1 Tax=Ruminococcus sp. TaxID=41978 RepID=UPI0025CF6435|nr:hypothetical protein [Ruminococcus sp.]MBR1430188.1 hypothetical protein [Ruminococcus sp.]